MIKTVNVLGYRVFSDHLSKIPLEEKGRKVLNTISPNSYGIATKDTEFRAALRDTDYLVLDGVYFALAAILLHGKNIKSNQGPDVFYYFMEAMNRNGGRVFFLGSTWNTLDKMLENTKLKYPGITAEAFSPPFKPVFCEEDNLEMIGKINSFHPEILFIGMTCPKQEKWAIQNRAKIEAGLIICIGNVFDWYAGTQKPIHPFWFKIKLGWFIRIILRPEIFRRNIGNQMKFFVDLLLIFLKLKKYD